VLTIKIREEEEGTERLVQAVSVSVDQRSGRLTAHGVLVPTDINFESGHVYAMNETGQTVGVYNLNKKTGVATNG
jgi:hypothetical protein